ncbi:hypothetical protein LDENG_00166800 [Lucifuga dentata]|nr:hypothetical protein LDENG_00166800 [Lucifuga dentata]
MSPDLNPVEYLWNVLKWEVERRQPSNLQNLTEIITEEWTNISQSTCADLVHSMPRHVQAVVVNNGGSTKY